MKQSEKEVIETLESIYENRGDESLDVKIDLLKVASDIIKLETLTTDDGEIVKMKMEMDKSSASIVYYLVKYIQELEKSYFDEDEVLSINEMASELSCGYERLTHWTHCCDYNEIYEKTSKILYGEEVEE